MDLEAAVLRVFRTLTRNGGKVSIGPPKTKNSRRTVGGLTDGAVEALRGHLTRQLEEMETVGSLYRPGGPVFANEVGGIVNPFNLRNRSLKALLKRAELPAIRFHDLRHTCATLLLSRNVNPKIVSEMLGHASIAIILETYSHMLPNMQESAVRALEEALNPQVTFGLALLHGCCTEAPGRTRSLCARYVFVLQNGYFFRWACLDSNQGPLPYQRSALTT